MYNTEYKTNFRNKQKELSAEVEIEKGKSIAQQTTVVPPEDEPPSNETFSKRPIISNSAKYTEEPDIKSNEQSEAADFGKLLLNDQSGDHFVFKSERNWQTSHADELPLQYFNLNVRELTKNILRIPFHERHQYPKDLFTPKELEDFDKKASKNENHNPNDAIISMLSENASKPKEKEIIKPILNQFEPKIVETPTKLPGEVKEPENEPTPANIMPSNVEIVESDDELDSILGLTNSIQINKNINLETNVSVVKPTQITDSNLTISTNNNNIKKDMQQWLDDIFDD